MSSGRGPMTRPSISDRRAVAGPRRPGVRPPILVRIRFPQLFSGRADVREWFDDTIGLYRISVDVRNRQWGRLFGYTGTFEVAWPAVEPGAVPVHILPIRQERRE